jgi:hypothetical protein
MTQMATDVRIVALAAVLFACGAPPTEVQTPKPVAASLCHDRATVETPTPRTVAGYPLAVAVLSQDEARARAATAETADWPQIRLDRFGFIDTVGSRKGFRPAGYPEGPSETGERPEDVALVQTFVDAHAAFFGPDPRDRVAGHGRIGSEYVMRFWGNGVISIQSIHTPRFLEVLRTGRAMPAPRAASDLLAPWVGVEIVKAPMPPPQMPCDPVTPSGRECMRSESPVPAATLTTFEASASTPTPMLRGEPPMMRSVAVITLARDERPCQKLPHEIDAVTGEVLDWTPASR